MGQRAHAPCQHCSGDGRNQQEYFVPSEASAWVQGIEAIQSEKDNTWVILAIPWRQDALPNETGSTAYYAGAE